MTPTQARKEIESLGWTIRRGELVSVSMNFERGTSRKTKKSLWTAEKGDNQEWGKTLSELLQEIKKHHGK